MNNRVTDISKEKTCDAIRHQWKFYYLIGAVPPEQFNFFYYIYFTLINLFVSIYYPLSIWINLCFISNFLVLLENLSMGITNAVCSFKVLNFFLYRKKLYSLKALFGILDKRIKFDDERQIVKKGVELSDGVFYFCSALYSLTISFSGLSTYLSNYNTYEKIMYPAWFPFDWTASKRNWYAAFLYQFIGLGIQGVQNACNDSYPVNYFIMFITQFKLLKKRIKRIGKDSKMSSKENYEELVNCIKDYSLLLE